MRGAGFETLCAYDLVTADRGLYPQTAGGCRNSGAGSYPPEIAGRLESLVELQVERIQRLAASQQSLMPQADDLRMINNALLRVIHSGTFFASIYVRLNRDTHKLILVNAGIPSAILVSGG